MARRPKKGGRIKIGELYAYLVEGGRISDEISRIKDEKTLQDIIARHSKRIFKKKIEWISQKGAFGDMFGLAEDRKLIIVEIKGIKSRGRKKTGYALSQIKRRVRNLKHINSRRKFINLCIKYGKKNPQEIFRRKLGLNLRHIRWGNVTSEFYLISTQVPKKVIKDAERIKEKYRFRGRKVRIQCLNINVFKRSGKKFLIMTRYL